MRAAFDSGTDIVELGIAPTRDGHLAVFHDWTLDCRTEASGSIRDHDWMELPTLDVAYGHSFDNGQTFPLRGNGIGLMPELPQVLDEIPDGGFLVNFKGNDLEEADMVAAIEHANSAHRENL